MTNIHQLPSRDECYDEASLWIEKLDEGLSTEETDALREWMAADSQNRNVLFEMAELWDKMDSLGRLSALFPDPATRRRGLTSLHVLAPIAATVLLVFISLWMLLPLEGIDSENDSRTAAATESIYETAVGEHATVALKDGTELVLNTNSRIRAKYTDSHRLLVLEAGEIHVKVAEDLARPLSVIAGDRLVQAVGTAFNVEITSDRRIELIVTEGEVRVGVHTPVDDGTGVVEPDVLPSSSLIVAEGEELILGYPEETITPVSELDVEVKLSWREGNLIFRGESLEQAVAEVERYTAVEFVILGEDLKARSIAGRFKAGDVDGLLAALRENFDIAYQRIGEQRVLLSAR